MQIVLNLQGHRLLAGIRQTLSSGSKEVDEIKLEVDETWKGFGKIAVFCVEKKCQYTVVDEVTQTAKIPAEVLRNEAVITIGIVGFKDEAVMTSTLVAYQVEKGSVVTIEDPEPSIYAEILSRYADLATRFNNIIANAGDLTNNAELIDARVGADNIVYDTAGEAIRSVGKREIDTRKLAETNKENFENILQLRKLILDERTVDISNLPAEYLYVTSTFSGWVSKFIGKQNFKIDQITFQLQARETAINEVRIAIALDERNEKNCVFKKIISVNIDPKQKQDITVEIPSVPIAENQSFYVAIESDVICNHAFFAAPLYDGTVTWYTTNGKHLPMESYEKGSTSTLYLKIIDYDYENKIIVTKEEFKKNEDRVKAFESGFDKKELVKTKHELLPVKNPNWGYTTSTFSGWCAPIGNPSNFNSVVFSVRNRESNSEPIKKIRCFIRKNNFSGETVIETMKTDFNILPGEEKEVIFNFPKTISNLEKEELYAGFKCDQYIDVKVGTTGINLNPPNYGNVYYFVLADGDDDLSVSYSGSPLYDPNKTNMLRTDIYACDISTLYVLNEFQLEEINDKIKKNSLRIILPDRFQAVVGDTLQLFYRGIIEHPFPYFFNIELRCDIGKNTSRYFEVKPTDEQIGEHVLTVNIRDNFDNILATSSTVLEVVKTGTAPDRQKNILCIGDSLTSSGIWCKEADRRLTASDGDPLGNGLENIKFIGTKQNDGTGYEGYGGWTWASYLSKPSSDNLDMWVYATHDKDSSDQHSLWNDSAGNIWSMETIESNRIKFTRYNQHTEKMPIGNGTLTHNSNAAHTNAINFTSTIADAGNPFWDNVSESVSFKAYCARNGFDKIDYMYTLLTWNGNDAYRETPEKNSTHINNAKTLIRKLHEDYPDAKVKIMGIQMPSLNGGTGENYGANSGYSNVYGLCRTVMGLNIAYQELANESEFSEYVEFINVSAQFDSENNMPQLEKTVNTRSKRIEMVGSNGVHPAREGYLQIADAAYRNMIARITNR